MAQGRGHFGTEPLKFVGKAEEENVINEASRTRPRQMCTLFVLKRAPPSSVPPLAWDPLLMSQEERVLSGAVHLRPVVGKVDPQEPWERQVMVDLGGRTGRGTWGYLGRSGGWLVIDYPSSKKW